MNRWINYAVLLMPALLSSAFVDVFFQFFVANLGLATDYLFLIQSLVLGNALILLTSSILFALIFLEYEGIDLDETKCTRILSRREVLYLYKRIYGPIELLKLKGFGLFRQVVREAKSKFL